MDNIVVEMLKQIKESKMNIGDLSNDIDIITALSINGKIVGYSIINKSKSPIKVFTLKDNAYICSFVYKWKKIKYLLLSSRPK